MEAASHGSDLIVKKIKQYSQEQSYVFRHSPRYKAPPLTFSSIVSAVVMNRGGGGGGGDVGGGGSSGCGGRS